MSQWQTFMRVLPTKWRRKPAGIEIASLSLYVYVNLLSCSFYTKRLF